MATQANQRSVSLPLIVLAVLGAVLVAFATGMFMPNTPSARTIQFVVFWIALYPVARLLWFASVPVWRYWAGLAVGTLVGWGLDTWRQGMSSGSNWQIGVLIFGLATVALISGIWFPRRKAETKNG